MTNKKKEREKKEEEGEEYSIISNTLTKNISKSIKKEYGIYFTPPEIINENIRLLEPYMNNIKNVLEPSCGSCEYVLSINKKYNNIIIKGIEKNETIFNNIKSLENKNIILENKDFITYKDNVEYDLIIGNPPFFVIKKEEIDVSYNEYFEGRPNIFIIFLIKSLKLLKVGGILSFILPRNFLNCLNYNKTRRYINENYEILHIVECGKKFIETNQETINIIIRNKKDISNKNDRFCLNIKKYNIFGTIKSIIKLKELYENSTTLEKLDFKVRVGNIIWNECKNILTDDKNKTLLIYSSDIKKNKIEIQRYSNIEKKNYINKEGDKGPILLLNRGYGVGKYNFNYCLLNEKYEYLIENHLISIKYKNTIENDKLIGIYEKIIKSFENKNTKEFIDLYFGNNAINTTELSEIIPIFHINQ